MSSRECVNLQKCLFIALTTGNLRRPQFGSNTTLRETIPFTDRTMQGTMKKGTKWKYGLYFQTLVLIRWLCYCHVPSYCDSLPHYELSSIFGRTFLRQVYSTVQRQLMDRFQAEKDRLQPERREMILTFFPKFLADMEMELGNDASPVWDPAFSARPIGQPSEAIKSNLDRIGILFTID